MKARRAYDRKWTREADVEEALSSKSKPENMRLVPLGLRRAKKQIVSWLKYGLRDVPPHHPQSNFTLAAVK